MNRDKITSAVWKDKLILTYGSFMLPLSGIKCVNGIFQRMRVLAGLYIILQEKNKQGNGLVDFMKPDTFDLLLSCTKELGGFSYQTTEGEKAACFSKLSLPLKIGYSLQKCAMILKGIGIKTRKPDITRNAEDFLELYKLE